MSEGKRVCVIGAGPSGMSVLYQFKQLKAQGKNIPEVVCFDKQSDWGGLWKYSWETGKEFTMLDYPLAFHFFGQLISWEACCNHIL